MSRVLVPVYIKPYLVPFLYQHFKADEKAQINGKKVKSVIIDKRTNFGKTIRLLVKKTHQKEDCVTTPTFFFSIQEKQEKDDYFGVIYNSQDGRSSYLEMPEEGVLFINERLEEKLLECMMFFIYGYHSKEGKKGLMKGIDIFLDKYNLYDHGYDVAAVRRKYYRWLERLDKIE